MCSTITAIYTLNLKTNTRVAACFVTTAMPARFCVRGGDKSCRQCNINVFFFLNFDIGTCDSVCVCVLGEWVGEAVFLRGCVLMFQQMGTADAEMLNTLRFETVSFKR